jgi:hypothetical protein
VLFIKFHWECMWSSGQSSWLQIQRARFDSRRYQIFWEVVGLERGPLSLVSAIEELLGRKSSFSGLERRDYGCRDPSRRPRNTLYPQELALTSPTSCGRYSSLADWGHGGFFFFFCLRMYEIVFFIQAHDCIGLVVRAVIYMLVTLVTCVLTRLF